MMLDVCKYLYNITIDIACGYGNVKNLICMCPDCDSFMQMCYLYNLNNKNLSLLCAGLIAGKTDEDSLKCSYCQIKKEICQDKRWLNHKVINMRSDATMTECAWNRFAKLDRDNQENLLYLVILLMTVTMIFPNRNICLADLICAYDAEVLERRFSKMVYKFVQDVRNCIDELEDNMQEKLCDDLHRIIEFLNNLHDIYVKRNEIFNQANHYLCCLYMGIEKNDKFLDWKNTTRTNILNKLKINNLGDNLETFLFNCGQMSYVNIKESFWNNVAIMKKLLIKGHEFYEMFEQKQMDDLLSMLEKFDFARVELIKIRGLERATFAIKESFKADTKLILDYLKKVEIISKLHNAKVDKKCWNTWEMALA